SPNFFANYLVYFDEALTYYLEAVGVPYGSLEDEEGVMFVYRKSECQYYQSLKFGEPLRTEAAIVRFGESSMTTAIRALRGDVLLAEGALISVCLGLDDRTKRRIPNRLREAVRRYEAA
ncbi:MAG: thioesterase family protein, partial [Myxococcota bacterium]